MAFCLGAAFTSIGGEQLPTTEFLFQLTDCEGPKPPVGVFINYGLEYCVILDCQLVINLVFGFCLSVYVEFFRVHNSTYTERQKPKNQINDKLTVQNNAIFRTILYEVPYRKLGSLTVSQLE
jgi:hypothetical protein